MVGDRGLLVLVAADEAEKQNWASLFKALKALVNGSCPSSTAMAQNRPHRVTWDSGLGSVDDTKYRWC
jgi:hypothetical protein